VYRIARREQFSENSFLWEIDAPDVAQAAQPGHFVMLCLQEVASASRSWSPTSIAGAAP